MYATRVEIMRKTYSAKEGEIERKWHVVDAENQILGRLATEVATLLRGKHKPQFTPHLDTGDFVIVVNADKVQFTGPSKVRKKRYFRHSGYPGGLTSLTLEQMMGKSPEKAIEKAVWGMLPKGSLGRKQFKKLKVYCGPDHQHEAQKPQPYTLDKKAAAKRHDSI